MFLAGLKNMHKCFSNEKQLSLIKQDISKLNILFIYLFIREVTIRSGPPSTLLKKSCK